MSMKGNGGVFGGVEKGGGGLGVGEGGWYRGWKGGVLEFFFFEKWVYMGKWGCVGVVGDDVACFKRGFGKVGYVGYV